MPIAGRRTSGSPTRPCGSDRPPRPSPTCGSSGSSRPPCSPAREAVHPGYGFLSEQAAFGAAVEAAGLVFVGPAPETLATLGDKLAARRSARRAGVPIVPGMLEPIATDSMPAAAELAKAASEVGFPLLIKAAAGGGGRGMRRVDATGDLLEALAAAAPRGRAGVRGRVGLPRALRRGRPACRGPAAGRQPGRHRGPRRAGLLHAAAPPEAGRRGARPGPRAGAARGPRRHGRARGQGRRAAERRDRRVPVRTRRLDVLPRGQRAAPGRARRDRARDRPRPRRRADPYRGWRAALARPSGPQPWRSSTPKPRHRAAHQRRGPWSRLPAGARPADSMARAVRPGHPHRLRCRGGLAHPA